MAAPGCRGADRQVRTTVATANAWPAARQAARPSTMSRTEPPSREPVDAAPASPWEAGRRRPLRGAGALQRRSRRPALRGVGLFRARPPASPTARDCPGRTGTPADCIEFHRLTELISRARLLLYPRNVASTASVPVGRT